MKKPIAVRFERWMPIGLSISVLAVVLSFAAIGVFGLHYGVDFLGGVKFVYHFEGKVEEGAIREAAAAAVGEKGEVIRFGEASENRFSVQLPHPPADKPEGFYRDALNAAFATSFPGAVLEQEENVGPKAGRELRNQGVTAVLLTIALILVYMAFRFNVIFAPGAILALIHDVIIPVGFFAVLGKEFNLGIVAVLLTILGYSINDTIIIFDRIRENEPRMDAKNYKSIVYESLNATLMRSLITSFTVFLTVFVLFLKGGTALRDFALAFMIGIIAGSYSSIFVAAPVYIFLKGRKGFGEKPASVARR